MRRKISWKSKYHNIHVDYSFSNFHQYVFQIWFCSACSIPWYLITILLCVCLQNCQLTILDDEENPRMEGDEMFVVFLSSAVSSNVVHPYTANIHIEDDKLDSKYFVLSICQLDPLVKSVLLTVYMLGSLANKIQLNKFLIGHLFLLYFRKSILRKIQITKFKFNL